MDTLDIAFAEARRFLASLETRPVASRGTPSEIRSPLPAHFPEHGMPATDVVRTIAAAAEPGLTANASGRFFAWVKGVKHIGAGRDMGLGVTVVQWAMFRQCLRL